MCVLSEAKKKKKEVRSSRISVVDTCEQPDVGARN